MRYFETLQLARNHRKNPTLAENVFWQNVKNRKFYGLKFNRQFLIEYKEILGNKLYYIADFHNFEHHLIIEIDGKIHEYQKDYDKNREDDMKYMGYQILRFTNEEVINNWAGVEKRILEFIPIPGPSPALGGKKEG